MKKAEAVTVPAVGAEHAPAVVEYLADNNSGKMTVPHAQNRIVMFNSDLFHETDLIDFKPEYENRRLNVTLLFGQRNN